MQVAMYKTLNKWLSAIIDYMYGLSISVYKMEVKTALEYVDKLENNNTRLKHQINHNNLQIYAIRKKYANRTKEVIDSENQ